MGRGALAGGLVKLAPGMVMSEAEAMLKPHQIWVNQSFEFI
jgi:hypothetical protein